MKYIKKATNIVLIAVLTLGIGIASLIPCPQEASAIGVVGSNAVKSVVIGSMEKAGVKFADKAAKDKAFQAWNMKAYERWKADEAAGRNKDLWDTWHAFEQNPSQYTKIEPIPDKPGLGKMVVESSIFGMAALLGWGVGSAIYDSLAGEESVEIAYMTDEYMDLMGGEYDMGQFGFSVVPVRQMDIPGYAPMSFYVLRLRDGTEIDLNNANSLTANISAMERNGQYINFYVGYHSVYIKEDGSPSHDGLGGTSFSINPDQYFIPEDLIYRNLPNPSHVPDLNPVPELAPLLAPDADLGVIKEVLPPAVPVEVIVPLAPETDPYWDGEINDPYTPPVPGTNPDGDPDAPPGTDPGKDPNTPPGTDPDGDPDAPPGTDPGKDEETPPGEDGEQPPKEDEENSCGESLKKPDFKKVGVAFTNAFPFSLPWDLKRFFDAAFSGIGSEKPSVDLTFLGDGVTLTIPDYFDSWVDVAKNLMVILFDISLIWMFARFMQRGGGD